MTGIFAYGAFGLIIGSFLNVVILRNGVRALGGRSICMSCGNEIRWFDLVPVFSWIWLGGKCRTCRGRISVQYPLVEILTSVLFMFIGVSPLSFLMRILGFLIAAILICIAVYDMRHTIIPDLWVFGFGALAFFYSFTGTAGNLNMSDILVRALAGPFTALPLFILWFTSKGRWMGFGDVKLALGIGWLLGAVYGTVAIFLAFVLGAVISLSLVFFSSVLWNRITRQFIPYRFWCIAAKGFTMKSEVPFGPFLIASCVVLWFLISYNIDPLQFVNVLLL
ncbi:hypothetical protein A3A37_00710 [Candidatus Kaiserbacteria bacterium RIFCSPLOWO2_01_FULL_52_36]|nr:MAG: hypothetical protein A3A37_00710 [Candidatus Kaiserbacteria bacterium RIFCSPLOWO2_01_FULL_52_36]